MIMASVLHRQRSVGVIEVLPSAPDYVSAPPIPSDPGNDGSATWPTRAKAVVAILAVATLVATIGAVIGFRDNGSTQRELRVQIGSLTVDRDEALAAARALDADIAMLRRDLQEARDGNDVLTADITELELQMVALTDRLADSMAADADAKADLGEALVTTDSLKAALATEQDRVAAAVTDRDALAALFPMKFTGSLTDVTLVGKYSTQLTQVYCSGLASCGTARSSSDFAIRRTTEGFLRIDGLGFDDVGLFQADGALHAVAGSTTALATCDGSPRTASVTMTMFPSRYEVAATGARNVAGITGVLTVQAPAVGNCAATLAFYSADFTPRS